jgi:hypothetical protein
MRKCPGPRWQPQSLLKLSLASHTALPSLRQKATPTTESGLHIFRMLLGTPRPDRPAHQMAAAKDRAVEQSATGTVVTEFLAGIGKPNQNGSVI